MRHDIDAEGCINVVAATDGGTASGAAGAPQKRNLPVR